MKSKHFFILFTLLFLSLSLSACAGGAATAASSWPGLTVDGETAYLAYNQHVYAINVADGKEKWRFPPEASNKRTTFIPAWCVVQHGLQRSPYRYRQRVPP